MDESCFQILQNQKFMGTLYYIVDSKYPNLYHDLNCSKQFKLYISSPANEAPLRILKKGALIAYMPMCSYDEMERINESIIFRTLPGKIDFKLRYDYFGGSIRKVFRSPTINPEVELNSHVSTFNPNQVFALSEEIKFSTASSFIVAATSNEYLLEEKYDPITHTSYYFSFFYLFASEYVTSKCKKVFIDHFQNQLESIINQSQEKMYLGAFRGYLFQDLIFKKLTENSNFVRKELCSGPNAVLSASNSHPSGELVNFRVQDKREIQSPLDLQSTSSVLGCFKSKTFPVLDCMISPNKLIQITVSDTHSIHLHHFETIINSLPSNSEPELYFVVPEGQYPAINHRLSLTIPAKKGRPLQDEAKIKEAEQTIQKFTKKFDSIKQYVMYYSSNSSSSSTPTPL